MVESKYPLECINFPKRFCNSYTLNSNIKGINVTDLYNIPITPRKKYFIISEWFRQPDYNNYAYDIEAKNYVKELNHNSIKSCKGLMIEINISDYSFQLLDNNNNKLKYIPECDFTIRPIWYHKIDGDIIEETTEKLLVNPIKYQSDMFFDERCALDAVKDSIDWMKTKCAKESVYLMQLQRWRKYNNPV